MIQNILVVDDSHAQLIILEKYLQQLSGVKIFKARSGEEALSLALDNDFSLALIDVRMPDMDGVELANLLSANEKTRQTAIIFLSAVYPDKLQLSQYNESIAVDFFLKPINKELLLCKVRAFLQLDLHSRNLEGLLQKRTKKLDETLFEWNLTINAISDYIAIIDVDHTILRANKSMIERFGSDVVGKKCWQVFHRTENCPQACPAINISEIQQENHTTIHEEHEDDQIDWYISVFPIKNETGDVTKYVHIARDITEQKRMDKKLKEGEKMLAIGQLAGGIAHDFNNQLTAILGYASLLKNKIGDNPNLKKFIDTIIISAKNSADLTKKLLTFSKRELQKKERNDIHKLIKEAVVLADRPINKKVKVELQMNASKPNVKCDASQMVNAFLNLILNANDAMPKGGTLTIATRNIIIDKSQVTETLYSPLLYGEYVEITIKDTGTGMPEEVQSHIFEPFFTTKKEKGTGLGLPAVYGTVESHNGSISVTSSKGNGTTFTIQLPIIDSINIGEETQFDIKDARDSNKQTPLVLLADDNASVRGYTQEILKALNYQVLSTENGLDAVECYKQNYHNIAFVILDIIMPEMNGREAYLEMKKLNPDVKVIFMSGYSEDNLTDLISDPNILLIKKPFTIKEFSNALKRYNK